MRKNLRDRKTTLGCRASRRVRWKYTEDYWVAYVFDPETSVWSQHGHAHRQIGCDGNGRLLWPDQTIHQHPRINMVLHTYRLTGECPVEDVIKNVVFQLNDLSGKAWYPPAGMVRGKLNPYQNHGPTYTKLFEKEVP